MLSNETIEFLNKYCDLSDKIFQDGGTNYILKFGRNLAHYLQEKHDKQKNYSKELNQIQLKQLQVFVDRSYGREYLNLPTEEAQKFCSVLIGLLYSDIKYEFIYVTDYESDEYTSELKLVMIKGNDYYSLELMWQLD